MRYSEPSKDMLDKFFNEAQMTYIAAEGAEHAYILYAKGYMQHILNKKGFRSGDLIQTSIGEKFFIGSVGLNWTSKNPIVLCSSVLKSGKKAKSKDYELDETLIMGAKKI